MAELRSVCEACVSLRAHAQALYCDDHAFAAKVDQYEAHFGRADDDLLAVFAQAATFCWHNAEYRENLAHLCRAIGTLRPTWLYAHCQISPRRWSLLHTYVIGAQKWLGSPLPLPSQANERLVRRVIDLLGIRSEAKELLVQLFLSQLVDDLANYLTLGRLGDDRITVDPEDCPRYADYGVWYTDEDGEQLAPGHALAPADGHRWLWQNETASTRADALKRKIRQTLADRPEDAQALIDGLTKLSQPPCMHRFSRYLDIQTASIGSLSWRGNLAMVNGGKASWHRFVDDATRGLEAWREGQPVTSFMSSLSLNQLAEPTAERRFIVGSFLLDARSASESTWRWLVEGAPSRRTTAAQIFGQP